MYIDKEAFLNTTRSMINQNLAGDTLFVAADEETFVRFALGEITHEELLAAKARIKRNRVQAKLIALIGPFLQEMTEVQVSTLDQLNRQHARRLRAVVKEMAGVLQFTWNGRFLTSALLDGSTPQGVPFCFGQYACPDFLVLNFQSSHVKAPNGQRTAVIYAIETLEQVIDVIFCCLTEPGRDGGNSNA